jgi:hypothetical protein
MRSAFLRGVVWLVGLILGGLPAGAVPLGFESGPHFFRTYPPALSSFIQLTNQAILYGNQSLGGNVPAIPLLAGGLGVRMAETLGEPFALGLGISLFAAGTGTEGTWGGQEAVAVHLGLSYADLSLLFLFSPMPGIFSFGVAGGFAGADLVYSVVFPNLNLSFVPASGERVYSGRTFVAFVFLRVAWPLFPHLTIGAEAGFRWALFPQLFSQGVPMDLNRDGKPDQLDLSGLWLGLTLRVELPL